MPTPILRADGRGTNRPPESEPEALELIRSFVIPNLGSPMTIFDGHRRFLFIATGVVSREVDAFWGSWPESAFRIRGYYSVSLASNGDDPLRAWSVVNLRPEVWRFSLVDNYFTHQGRH